MALADENRPLIHDKTQRQDRVTFARQLRFFLTIGVPLLVFKACEEMANTTFKQFLYQWCKENTPANNSLSAAKTKDDCASNTSSKVSDDTAQKLASHWELYFTLANNVIAFFSVSILGTISDYTGRKIFLRLAMLGYGFRTAVASVVIYFKLHVAYNMIGYVVDGMLGTNYGVSLFSYSSAADNSGGQMKQRVLAVAITETILGVGRLTTQFGNGYFIHDKGFFYPMLTAAAGMVFASFLTLIVSQESSEGRLKVAGDSEKAICCPRLPPIKTLFRNYTSFYVHKGSKHDKSMFWLCLAIFVIHEMAMQGRSNPIVLFQLASPFCWSSETIGWYNAMYIGAVYIFGCIMLKPLQRCFSSGTIACLGFGSSVTHFLVTGLATSSVWIFSGIGAGTLMVLPKSILRGITSSKASVELQGAMFASLQSSELASALVSNPLSLTIYAGTVETMKGLIFLVLGGFDLVALVLMICLTRMLAKAPPRTITIDVPAVNKPDKTEASDGVPYTVESCCS